VLVTPGIGPEKFTKNLPAFPFEVQALYLDIKIGSLTKWFAWKAPSRKGPARVRRPEPRALQVIGHASKGGFFSTGNQERGRGIRIRKRSLMVWKNRAGEISTRLDRLTPRERKCVRSCKALPVPLKLTRDW